MVTCRALLKVRKTPSLVPAYRVHDNLGPEPSRVEFDDNGVEVEVEELYEKERWRKEEKKRTNSNSWTSG